MNFSTYLMIIQWHPVVLMALKEINNEISSVPHGHHDQFFGFIYLYLYINYLIII